MDKNVVDLITGLAWPFVVLVAIGVFGDTIKAGISELTSKLKSIKSIKAGAFEAVTQEAEEPAAEATLDALKLKPVFALQLESTYPNNTNNMHVIEAAFREIEQKLDSLLKKKNIPIQGIEFNNKIKILENKSVLTETESRALRGLNALYMITATGPQLQITDDRAKEFLGISAAINYFLSTKD